MTKNSIELDDTDKPTEEEIKSEITRLRLDGANIEYLKREVARLNLENIFLHAQVKVILDRGKKFALRLIAISKGKLDLSELVISNTKHGELNPYESEFIKAVESAQGRKRRKKQLAGDIKQEEKDFVKQCWENWQQEPSLYKNKSRFAQKMIEKCRPDNPADEEKHLNSTQVIRRWCKEWEDEK